MIPSQETSLYGGRYDMTGCVKKCIKIEKSRFAKKCKKDGGYFKCCVKKWHLHTFEETRNQLIKDKLINDTVTDVCDKTSRKDRCLFCSSNGMCTKRNKQDGTVTNVFYQGRKKRSKSMYTSNTNHLK